MKCMAMADSDKETEVSLTTVGGNLDIQNPSRYPQFFQLNLFLLSFCSKLFKTLNAMLIPAADWL